MWLEFRRKNFPHPKEFPFTTPTGLTYDSAKYQESLAKALKLPATRNCADAEGGGRTVK